MRGRRCVGAAQVGRPAAVEYLPASCTGAREMLAHLRGFSVPESLSALARPRDSMPFHLRRLNPPFWFLSFDTFPLGYPTSTKYRYHGLVSAPFPCTSMSLSPPPAPASTYSSSIDPASPQAIIEADVRLGIWSGHLRSSHKVPRYNPAPLTCLVAQSDHSDVAESCNT